MSRRKEPVIPNALLDQLLAGGAASAAFEQGGLLDSLKKALTERALNAEMDHHLDASKNPWRSAPLSDSLPLAMSGGGDGAAGWILGLRGTSRAADEGRRSAGDAGGCGRFRAVSLSPREGAE